MTPIFDFGQHFEQLVSNLVIFNVITLNQNRERVIGNLSRTKLYEKTLNYEVSKMKKKGHSRRQRKNKKNRKINKKWTDKREITQPS